MGNESQSEERETVVTLELNRQQLELLDRTVARGVAPDRASLVRLALAEHAARRAAERK
jgi:Arc/MetJ-type ribon-helix-helix transcriptional regulator